MVAMDLGKDLFGQPALPGLSSIAEVIGAEEEAGLVRLIESEGLSPFRFHGWTGKRMTRSFGWNYDFETGGFEPAEPIPGWLIPLRNRVAQAAGLVTADIEQVLLTRYDPGAGIGWHRDRSVFGEVLGLSLGAPASMRFRKREGKGFKRVSMPLPPRGIYRLAGEARHEWEHSIAMLNELRWSITFRTLA